MGPVIGRFLRRSGLISDCGPSQRTLMVGLDGAGKTSILYRLKLGSETTTIPTIGFNVEQVESGNMSLLVWDIGGQQRLRPIWRHYFYNAAALIFVVDSVDRGRIQEAREELERMLQNEELRDIPLLVYANKQDLSEALAASEVAEALGLPSIGDRAWHVQGSSVPSAAGLKEGLQWLSGTYLQPPPRPQAH